MQESLLGEIRPVVTVAPILIQVQNVGKIYTSKKKQMVALQDVSFDVRQNEFVSIVGPSGCGKSTLLRMIAGLDHPTSGSILMSGRVIDQPGADRGMVFQTYTLFPWLTVYENIEFGLRLKKMSPSARREKVEFYLHVIGLERFADAYPKSLSGGMKQRVAIARAMANEPEVLLMDEPFGALDAQTKHDMQQLLSDIWESTNSTIIFITHDIEEALFLSERVYVMGAHPGRIQKRIRVPFAHRDSELRDREEFIKLKREIIQLLKTPKDTDKE